MRGGSMFSNGARNHHSQSISTLTGTQPAPISKGRVLLPVLGDQYGVILEQGDLALRFDAADGSFSVWYFDHRFPISPRSYAAILAGGGETSGRTRSRFSRRSRDCPRRRRASARPNSSRAWRRGRLRPGFADAIATALQQFTGSPDDPESFAPLHRLLEAQSYRIADWRVAGEEINYRRFFNINDLAGLRMELPELFDKTHRLMFQLIGNGELHGLRIDHIDGLFDPRGYCNPCSSTLAAAHPQQQAYQKRAPEQPLYVLVEKILAHYELLPDWPVAGTTGYDFVNQVLGIFVDAAGEAAMSRLYRRMIAAGPEF